MLFSNNLIKEVTACFPGNRASGSIPAHTSLQAHIRTKHNTCADTDSQKYIPGSRMILLMLSLLLIYVELTANFLKLLLLMQQL